MPKSINQPQTARGEHMLKLVRNSNIKKQSDEPCWASAASDWDAAVQLKSLESEVPRAWSMAERNRSNCIICKWDSEWRGLAFI